MKGKIRLDLGLLRAWQTNTTYPSLDVPPDRRTAGSVLSEDNTLVTV